MLRGSSSWRIQFLKDPTLEGGSNSWRRIQLLEEDRALSPILEDPAVRESNSRSAWFLEEDSVLSSLMLSQPPSWADPCAGAQ